jgi:hypothetical protein
MEHIDQSKEQMVNSYAQLKVSGGTYVFHTKSLLASRRNLVSVVCVLEIFRGGTFEPRFVVWKGV